MSDTERRLRDDVEVVDRDRLLEWCLETERNERTGRRGGLEWKDGERELNCSDEPTA
jgi:hypothetical protein